MKNHSTLALILLRSALGEHVIMQDEGERIIISFGEPRLTIQYLPIPDNIPSSDLILR
jgi:hypothetical protein